MQYSAAGVIQYLSMRLDFVRDIDHEVIRRVANYVVKGDWSMAEAEEFLRQVQAQDVRLKSGNPPRNAVPSLNRTATQMLQQQEAARERMKYWESCEELRRARLAALDTFGIPPDRVPKDSNRATAEASQQESTAEQMMKLWNEIMEEDFRPSTTPRSVEQMRESHTARMQEVEDLYRRWTLEPLPPIKIPSSFRTAEQQAEIQIAAMRLDDENRYRLELLKDMTIPAPSPSYTVPKELVDEWRAGRRFKLGVDGWPVQKEPEPEICFLTSKRKIVLE